MDSAQVTHGWLIVTSDLRDPVPSGSRIILSGQRTLADDIDVAVYSGLPEALRSSSLWPMGRPCSACRVSMPETLPRPSVSSARLGLNVLGVAAEQEIIEAIDALSERFGEHSFDMFTEQVAWRHALGRPEWSEDSVIRALQEAIEVRDLGSWAIRRLETPAQVWQAWLDWARDAPTDANRARDDWGLRDSMTAMRQWIGNAADLAADWHTWDPWRPQIGMRFQENVLLMADLCAARAAFAAHFALTVRFAAMRGWVSCRRDLLSVGVREAYQYGLEVAIPVGEKTLGWTMAETRAGS